jgi:hypothetical protein
VFTFAACNSGTNVSTAVPEQKPTSVEPAPANPTPTPSPWTVSASTNELTGEATVVAMNGYGDQLLIVRRRGKTLDCYVKTGKFLETVDNMESRHMVVKYKFDDGEIVRQAWTISDDNTALFFSGNPSAFLQKMRQAKRFVIEYKPADVIPETASFDVSQFPTEFGPKESTSK